MVFPIHFSDVKITVNVPEAEEVAFTLVANKSTRERSKSLLFLLYLFLTLEAKHCLFYRFSLFIRL